MRALLSAPRLVQVLLSALALLLVAPAAEAQPPDPWQRDSLEVRVRQRMAQILKTQLGLTDEQVRRLALTNRRFEGQRRVLLAREAEARRALRGAIESDDSTQVGALLDRTISLQRERLDLTEAEQKELATFLTPVQRAKLFGMEEQIRRRMAEMRDDRMQQRPAPGRRPGDDMGPRPGAGGPPPRRPPGR